MSVSPACEHGTAHSRHGCWIAESAGKAQFSLPLARPAERRLRAYRAPHSPADRTCNSQQGQRGSEPAGRLRNCSHDARAFKTGRSGVPDDPGVAPRRVELQVCLSSPVQHPQLRLDSCCRHTGSLVYAGCSDGQGCTQAQMRTCLEPQIAPSRRRRPRRLSHALRSTALRLSLLHRRPLDGA